jgi:phenylalanyl-tRNA synthetase beta chain
MARQLPGVPRPILTPLQVRERTARRTIAALGYNECVTYSFIDARSAALFGGGTEAVRVENPISSEMTHLRPDLLPGLLSAAARNQARGFMDLSLFEIGPAFHGGEPGDQHLQAPAFWSGPPPSVTRTAAAGWSTSSTPRPMPRRCWPPSVRRPRPDHPQGGDWWHPGRSGVIGLGPNVMATFGEVHPRILQAMDVKGPAVAFTILVANVPAPKVKTPTRPALAISDLQAVDRDFAFVVDAKVEALTAVNAAQGADKALIESVRVFDQFTGDKAEAQMGAGKKSIALTVRLQPQDQDPDRGRDRGRQRQDHREGDEGHRRNAAQLDTRGLDPGPSASPEAPDQVGCGVYFFAFQVFSQAPIRPKNPRASFPRGVHSARPPHQGLAHIGQAGSTIRSRNCSHILRIITIRKAAPEG